MSNAAFSAARAKLCIASIDDPSPSLQVRAQYNPKELQIDKKIQWEEHKALANQSDSQRRQDQSQQDDQEYKSGSPRSMSIELLFDGYERGESVEPDVLKLETLASVQNPEAPASQQPKRRPHHCIITWGASSGGMRPFPCVIESLAVKYTMWNHSGMPVRATCTITVKEALKMTGSRGPAASYAEVGRAPRWAEVELPRGSSSRS